MKRFMGIIMAIAFVATLSGAAIAGTEGAVVYTLYLSKNPGTGVTTFVDTGVTTVASGTSSMVVGGSGYDRLSQATVIHDLDKLSLGTCVIQLKDIAVSQGQQGASSKAAYAGATFTLRYRESAISASGHQTKALANDLYTGMALNGNSLYQVEFFPTGMGDIDFQYITGITPFDYAIFEIKMSK